MKIFFKDELFDAQLRRALNTVYYGGADVGECISTAERITELNAESWYQEWLRTAERIDAAGEACLKSGQIVSAREAFLRASNYYRTAYIFLIGQPLDARVVRAFEHQTAAFQKAGALFSPAFEPITIPYEQTSLPGSFFQIDDRDQPRPTLIVISGYDSTAEEMYFFNAAAALRRGYNCLCFDGPGQGAALIKQGLVFRPDWEHVVGPVVDYALTRPEVDRQRIALMGASFGGYLAPRAASREHRLAACIADPGEFDLFTALKTRLPGFLARQIPDGNGIALAALRLTLHRLSHHLTKGWAIRRGMWVHGVASPLEYLLISRDYTLKGYAEQIACPTLVCYADHDDLAVYARQLFDTLTCPKHFLTFTSAEGAGEHCEFGNRSLFHQRVFDWLDTTLHVAGDVAHIDAISVVG
jgi:pimeloyl-ACP methyl ester carboxylesterase